MTHPIEYGVDPKVVQEQVGHIYASTTGLHTQISAAAMNTMMDKALERAFAADGDER